MIISDSEDQADTEDRQTDPSPSLAETDLLPRKKGLYEFFQTQRGKKIILVSWHSGHHYWNAVGSLYI